MHGNMVFSTDYFVGYLATKRRCAAPKMIVVIKALFMIFFVFKSQTDPATLKVHSIFTSIWFYVEHMEFYIHMDFALSFYILYKYFNMDCMGCYCEQCTRNFTLLLSGVPTKEEITNKEEEEGGHFEK